MTYGDVPQGKLAAIVTSLEMLERPPPRLMAPEPELTLARAERPDTSWFRGLFRKVGEDWLWFSRLEMSDEALRSIIHDPLVEVYVPRRQGNDVGLLELDFREPDVCELSFFGLAMDVIGIGAGRWMMSNALELAWSRPIRRFWVHTCTFDHPDALDFYVRSGFRAFRRQIEIVGDPRLSGVLPRSAAPHVPII